MRKPSDIQGLANRLSSAAATPVGTPTAMATAESKQTPAKAQKRGNISVFLRLPPELFAKMDAEAIKRTKATGRGVTVQHVIVEKLKATT